MDLLRRLRLFVRAHPYWADALLAAVLYLVTILWPTGGRPSTQWSNFDPDEVLLVAGLCVYAPLALRRRYPILVLACTVAATVGYMFVGPVRGPILAGSGLAIYTVSSVVERRLALAIGGVAVLSVGIASMALSPEKWDESVNGIAFAWTAMTVAVGESVRSRRAFVAAIEERARRAEHTREEEARRRVAEERLRIARELHDIVGHHIALINIQAGVASTVLDSQPDTARAALAQVREAGRAALSELGATVAVLRQTGEGEEVASPREPAPGLGQLAQLLDSFERAGLRVKCRTEGEPVPIPATVDLTAYRVVQESLTNVRKHADASAASVRLDYRPGVLHIEVDDDGGPGPKPAATKGGSPTGGAGGFGLIGMRERAASVGGAFSAGPRPEGGFRVTVDLPLGAAGRAVGRSGALSASPAPAAPDGSRGPGLPRMNLPNLLGPFRPPPDADAPPAPPGGEPVSPRPQRAGGGAAIGSAPPGGEPPRSRGQGSDAARTPVGGAAVGSSPPGGEPPSLRPQRPDPAPTPVGGAAGAGAVPGRGAGDTAAEGRHDEPAAAGDVSPTDSVHVARTSTTTTGDA